MKKETKLIKKNIRYFVFVFYLIGNLFNLYAQTNYQYKEYPTLEALFSSNFKNMIHESYKQTVEQYGLSINENRQRFGWLFSEYKGIVDELEITIVGMFYDDDPFLESVLFYIKRPSTPIERFQLFEKLSDYITVLYGNPSFSLFEIADGIIKKRNTYIFNKGFKDYTSAKNYKELIIQSESSLIGNKEYYNSWRWSKEKGGFRIKVPGLEEGSAKIELVSDNIVITFSSTLNGA